jgi:hypothetical protein
VLKTLGVAVGLLFGHIIDTILRVIFFALLGLLIGTLFSYFVTLTIFGESVVAFFFAAGVVAGFLGKGIK